jgi:hypothetical protein
MADASDSVRGSHRILVEIVIKADAIAADVGDDDLLLERKHVKASGVENSDDQEL